MRRRPSPAREAGTASTEAVLLTPVLLFVVMLVVQFGLWFHAEHVVQAAAREGVRAARAEGSSAESGETRAAEFLAATGPTIVRDPQVSASVDADRAVVNVSGYAVHIVPGLPMPVRATAAGEIERFRGDLP